MSGPDPQRHTDLERIDDALAKGRVGAEDPRERELQGLALALRADSPEAEPRFAAELDRRVAAGFKKPRSRPAFLRAWKPMLAGAVALLLVVVAVTSVLSGSHGSSDSASSAGPAGNLREFNAVSADPSPSSPAAAPGRRVERSASITLSTPAGKIQAAADGVGTVAESHGGFVENSNVSTGDEGEPGGTFTLRVPARQLQSTLADLSKLGHMQARTESAQDMTAPFKSTEDKLGTLLIERSALRLRLRRAHGAKADRIRVEIARVTAHVNALSGRMRALKSKTSYSTVNVSLRKESGGAGAGHGGGGGTGAAFRDSLHNLQALLNFCVRALGVLLPLLLAAAIAAFGARALRRRRREGVLL